MLKIILAIVVVVVVAVLALAATKPDTFTVQRSTTVQAPPERVFAALQDFHRWAQWSPWEKLDPAMKRTHSGAPSGKGAVYAWEGNSKVGAGRMEILSATAPNRLDIQLDFLKPFEGHNITEFTLVPQGNATTVNWSMHGPAPFVSKLMQVFVSMDAMVGKDFESGLANLKAVSEQP